MLDDHKTKTRLLRYLLKKGLECGHSGSRGTNADNMHRRAVRWRMNACGRASAVTCH